MSDFIDALFESASDEQLAVLARRLVPYLAPVLQAQAPVAHEWLDSAGAAEYLGMHRDTVNRLAAQGQLPSSQDGPNTKRWFQRDELDSWRRLGSSAQVRRIK